MPDVSFPFRASNSAGNRGATLRHRRHPSTADTNYPGMDYVDHQDVSIAEGSQTESTFSALGEEASIPVGTKRPRGLDKSDDKDSSSLTTGEVFSDADLISTIVTGAKRLRISDKAADDRDNELHHSLIIQVEKHQEEQDPALQVSVTQTPIISQTPSLSGLSEELIFEIIQKLTVTDIMALRRTNKRLAYITRARVLWINRLCQLLDHLYFTKSPATLLLSQLTSCAIEHVVVRPHIFDYKWLRSIASHQNPIKSRNLSTSWSEPEDIRFPILMPGGRWLVAAYDDGRSPNSGICLWDLDYGTLKWLPEAQTVAEGRVCSLDMKMDRKSSFAFLAVLSEREDVAAAETLVHQVDVYKVIFKTDADASTFHRIDSLPLDTRRAPEVQIYPQYGRVIVDLFDRVLLWDYAPYNKCTWMSTSNKRRRLHRSAHAITHTHKYILVADGDESMLRVYNLPPAFQRPAQLRDLPLVIIPVHLVLDLPSFTVSLRFSTDRLVDISAILETATQPLTLSVIVEATTAGTNIHVAQMSINIRQGEHDDMRFSFERSGRGFLFIDAASCDSYILCSYPIHEIDMNAGSPNTLSLTTIERGDARERARTGSHTSSGSSRTNTRYFFAPAQTGGRRDSSVSQSALWVGTMGGISTALAGDSSSPRLGARDLVLLQSPDHDGSLITLSTLIPSAVDLGPDQSRIADIEQGVAKTVLSIPLDKSAGARARRVVRVEEASVDEISGKVCIVETMTVADKITNHCQVQCGLRLLEYA